jgi:hypothetical protein
MRRAALLLGAALVLVSCGQDGDGDSAGVMDKAPKALGQIQIPVYDTAPKLGLVTIGNASPFCSFFAKGHDFVFDDPDTWQFVFVTVFDERDTPPDALDGLVSLNGETRRVELITQDATDTGEIRTYRTKAAPVAVLTVTMNTGEAGLESQSYTGTVQVTLPEGGAPVTFDGDCGV